MPSDILGFTHSDVAAYDYGCRADNNTDSALALNNALNAASIAGATRVILPGTDEKVNQGVIFIGSTVNLQAGIELIIPPGLIVRAKPGFSGAMFSGTSLNGLIIWNRGTIDGNNAATVGVDLTDCPGPIVHDGTIQNCTVAATRTSGCDDARVQYVNGDNCSQLNNATFYNVSGSNRIKFLHCNVTHPADGSRGIAIHTDQANCDGAIVDSCMVDFSTQVITQGSTLGIETYGSTAFACPHGQVRNCKVYTPFSGTVYGISVNLPDGEVSGCYVGTKPFSTTLAAAIASTSATSATTAAGIPFALAPSTTYYFQIDLEIIGVTAGVSGTAWTITRAQYATTAATHLINATATLVNFGIDIGIEAGTSGTKIVDNTVDGIASIGIAIDGSFSPQALIVARNKVSNARPNSSLVYGLQDTDSTGSAFLENGFIDAGGVYLLVNNTNGGHTISHNKCWIKNDPATNLNRKPIYVVGGNKVSIIGNQSGPMPGGTSTSLLGSIEIDAGSYDQVLGNYVDGISPDGSFSTGDALTIACDHSTIGPNFVSNFGNGDLIHETGAGFNHFEGNVSWGTTTVVTLGTSVKVGVNGATSSLPLLSGVNLAVTATSAASYTIVAGDSIIAHTAGGANASDLLPAATGSGRYLTIFKADSGAGSVVVTPNGSDKINGAASVSLASQYVSAVLHDATVGEWEQIALTGSFASPTITGTVGGGATYSSPTLTSPVISGSGGTSAGEVGYASGKMSLGNGSANLPVGVYQLAQVVVGVGGQASIDFSTIAQSYTQLRVVYVGRSDNNASGLTSLNIKINGDTGANYVYQQIQASGAAIATSSATQGSINETVVPMALNTAGTAASLCLDIFGYSGTTYFKNFTAEFSDGSITLDRAVGQWHSAAAITDITLTLGLGNFAQASVATLYGVP